MNVGKEPTETGKISTVDSDPASPVLDAAVALFLLLGGTVVFIAALRLPDGTFGQLGAGYVPAGLAALTTGFAAVLTARSFGRLVRGESDGRRAGDAAPRYLLSAFIALATIAYVAAMAVFAVNYALATAAFLFATISVASGFKRRWLLWAGLVAVIVGVGC